MYSEDARAIVELLDSEWVAGGSWNDVPMYHDILPIGYLIYNEKVHKKVFVEGVRFKFVKLDALPSPEEANSVQWKTIDLMNQYGRCKGGTWLEIYCLRKAFLDGKLRKELIIDLASRYGNKATQSVLAKALDLNYILHHPIYPYKLATEYCLTAPMALLRFTTVSPHSIQLKLIPTSSNPSNRVFCT